MISGEKLPDGEPAGPLQNVMICNGPAGSPSGNFMIISYFVYSTGQYMLCMEAIFRSKET
jgi:hypothetical protein